MNNKNTFVRKHINKWEFCILESIQIPFTSLFSMHKLTCKIPLILVIRFTLYYHHQFQIFWFNCNLCHFCNFYVSYAKPNHSEYFTIFNKFNAMSITGESKKKFPYLPRASPIGHRYDTNIRCSESLIVLNSKFLFKKLLYLIQRFFQFT